MPRDGSQIYHIPPGTEGVPDTTIESDRYNAFIHDVEQDLNAPRPIVAGGTGADDADEALANLKAEKASQQVTNYDSHAWVPGSFWSATSATNPPVASHAFAGVVYTNGTDIVVEATDLTDAAHHKWLRAKTGGTWGSWVDETDDKVSVAGDTMTGDLTISKSTPTIYLNKTGPNQSAQIIGQNGGVSRWLTIFGNSTAEGGSNSGSDFDLYPLNDAGGATLGVALHGDRATGLLTVKGDPTAALGIVTKQYVDATATYLVAQDALKVNKAGDTLTGSLDFGVNQYSSRFSGRRSQAGADFEWGHANTAGYGCTLACDFGAGVPFIGFYCGPGTTNNTYRTFGLPGCLLKPDGGGGFTFYNVPGANADNQAIGAALFWVTNSGAVAGSIVSSAAEYWSNSASKMVSTNTVWAASAHQVLTDAASVAPNFAAGIHFNWSITAINRTLANPTNAKDGQSGTITIYNGVGGVTISSWGSLYKFPGGVKPSPSTAGGAFDVLSYVVQGDGNIYCTYANGMA